MAGLKLSYEFVTGQFDAAMKDVYRPIAVAAKSAMAATAAPIKSRGRAQIRAAGFKNQYATAFRVDVYPKGAKASANAAIVAYHKVDYSEVFEEGIRIGGKPYLWVPIRDKRTRIGKKQLRLKDFKARGEKLVMVKRAGKAPLLMGRPLSGMPRPRRKSERESYKVYQAGGLVPLFVGVSKVDLSKRLNIYPLIDSESAHLPQRYFAALDPDT